MRPMPFWKAVAGQEFESLLDESLGTLGMRLDWSEVDALVVGGVPARGFLPVPAQDS
jgi:hypothetical protein